MTPIEVPMTIETTETTVVVSVADDAQEIQYDIDHVTAPVQIDFTADTETLAAGSDVSVTYSQKHFHFAIPRGAKGDQGPQGETGASGSPGRDGADGKDGTDGVTFTPSVSSAGVISWTNDGGQQNPTSVDLVAAVLAALPTWNGGVY